MIGKRAMKYVTILLFAGSLTLSACSSVSQFSKFSSTSISIGTAKDSVLSTFGKPIKSEFWINDSTGFYEEKLYYKETFAGQAFEQPYTITNILFFVDGKLKSLTQGQETRLRQYPQRKTDKKDD
ncbi:hypothetical protein PQ465_07260 [Sphingobacterium oryzagri]|uniref:Uncharacterized protein n=1 Tax=Sphingobacterium oryzagri TaxID=3025669 RepID=A0ABY7WP23_9SPHI|nr:hypothetical protein [Sphingobacterium sp. KACC 22765]WDF70168.1 hypothetical protein PQ465_07260 [Sphingobacterium sp. KACC 22765]